MMRLLLNGLAASAGAGLTYFRNVVPHLSATAGIHTTIALSPALRQEFGDPGNISFLEVEPQSAGRRFWYEQTELAGAIRRSRSDILISTGNFALRRSPIPQILLSGNSLYTSEDFYHDLAGRREYRMWLDTRIRGMIAKRSVHWADCTVAPSQAFAAELHRWTGGNVTSIYHGFDHDAFFRDQTPLPSDIAQRLRSEEGTLRLLFVSHYNYYRNFETLFRALPLLKQQLKPAKVKLHLTCHLSSGMNPGSYRTGLAAKLVRDLGVTGEVVELGSVPYSHLHQVYRCCDIYVTAAYAETFAHPLVEAMACGLPVIASSLPVHREVCGTSGLFFDRFSSHGLAEEVLKIARSPNLRHNLGDQGLNRSQEFSWHRHVEEIISLARGLLEKVSVAP